MIFCEPVNILYLKASAFLKNTTGRFFLLKTARVRDYFVGYLQWFAGILRQAIEGSSNSFVRSLLERAVTEGVPLVVRSPVGVALGWLCIKDYPGHFWFASQLWVCVQQQAVDKIFKNYFFPKFQHRFFQSNAIFLNTGDSICHQGPSFEWKSPIVRFRGVCHEVNLPAPGAWSAMNSPG